MENNIESVMIKVAKGLNSQKINWAVGASAMLCLRGIEISVRDIDIMVSEEHFLIAHTYLSSFLEELVVGESKEFKTAHFKRYYYNGVEIDLMSGMGIVYEGGWLDYRFIDFNGYVKVQNVNIPVCYIEDWYVFYHLISNRENTIRLIESYFNSYPVNNQRINELLNLSLPVSVREIIVKLINK